MTNTINNAIGLLEECISNGKTGPYLLHYWFTSERTLIERTIEELNELEEEERLKDLADDLGNQEYLNEHLVS